MESPLHELDPETVPDRLVGVAGLTHPEWLPDLARLELLCHRALSATLPTDDSINNICLNPSLELAELQHRNLLPLITFADRQDMLRVTGGSETVLVWQEPATGILRYEVALPDHLLALKLVAEEISPEEAAHEAGISMEVFDSVLWDAVRKGILLAPSSKLKRKTDRDAAEVFTLQWHLTQNCDLHCKHCYDRSQRNEFPYERAMSLMQELRDFCWHRFIKPQISFTGGNPLLHPRFYELYQAASDCGIETAILGNATDRESIEKILTIRRPAYYQVSLEGLEPHNDKIRGKGNYQRTVEFLKMLTGMGVPNLVMLTLTKENMEQVIPLAEKLEGITGALAFNRLTLFGEGAALAPPSNHEFRQFIEQYVSAMPDHPVLALKDNLLNCVFEEQGQSLFGGCTGFGCGAAFNFVAVLSDGEVHACRKFPSRIGNILNQSLEEIYSSESAQKYRSGCDACNDCSLKPVCGGCMAVAAGCGLDPFKEKDPYCTKTGHDT